MTSRCPYNKLRSLVSFRVEHSKVNSTYLRATRYHSLYHRFKLNTLKVRPGACFSKVPKLFGPISGTTIPFISSQRRGSKPSNFAVLLIFLILKACKKISFSKRADCSLTTSFSGPKSFRDVRETGPWFHLNHCNKKNRENCRREKKKNCLCFESFRWWNTLSKKKFHRACERVFVLENLFVMCNNITWIIK